MTEREEDKRPRSIKHTALNCTKIQSNHVIKKREREKNKKEKNKEEMEA